MAFKLNIRSIVSNAKAGVRNAVTAIKNAPGKAADKAKAILDRGKEASMLVLFRPFSVVAKKFLQRRGVAPANSDRGLVMQMFKESRKKNYGLTDGREQDSFDLVLEIDESLTEKYGLASEGGEGGGTDIQITPGMIQSIIVFLTTIFQQIKQKKESGKALSADEQAIADLAPEIEQAVEVGKVEAAAIDEESKAQAEGLLAGNWKMILLAVLLLLLIIWLATRKK